MVFFCMVLLNLSVSSESLSDLINKGTEAYNQSDIITSAYYLNRARSHEEWQSFTGKMDVFSKLAYIEESQGHFDDAARYYREALRHIPEIDEANRIRLEQYYNMRYAATLDRSGYYQAAEKIYWELFARAEPAEKTQLLQLITENYKYQEITTQQMENLHEQIEAADWNALGWGLAELYRMQGDIEKSYDVYNRIWQQSLPLAVEHYLPLAEVYEKTGHTEELINQIKSQFTVSPLYLKLFIVLMEYQNQSKEAIKEVESYFHTLLSSTYIPDAGVLNGLVPNELLIAWIELIEETESADAAAQRTREILNANPMDIEWRQRLSNLYIEQNNHTEAVQLWKEWFLHEQSNEFQQLYAVEQIHQLGDPGLARELFLQLEERIPVPLKQFEAKSALELGLFEQAISSFHIASISANVNPAGITNMILQFAETQTEHKPVINAMIQAASGNAFQETPVWLRDALVECGIKYGMESALKDMAAQDATGIWNIQIANTAMKYGKNSFAQSLLETVPGDSVFRRSADQQVVKMLSGDPSIPNQNQAADKILPEIADIVGVTEALNLSEPQIQNLMQYTEYRLNAFEPGQALTAIQTIESSSPFKDQTLLALDVERLTLNRARALSQLSSYEPALQLLDTITLMPYQSEAQFLKARILMALKQFDEADAILQSLITGKNDWQLANNALSYILAKEPLIGEPMSEFCTLQSYLLQGRMEDAFTILRRLAVDFYQTDTEEWARYQIGWLKALSGHWDEAVEEWKRLLLDADHPVFHGLVRYQLTHVPSQAGRWVDSASQFQELVTEFPNSLFSDLARIETEERLKGLYP